MTSRTQQRRTSTPNSPPVGLVPGELAVEMADPLRLWVGVPTTLDPAARRLLVDGAPGNMKAYVDAGDAALQAAKVDRAGDTMTGPLKLPAGTAATTSLNFGTNGTGLYGLTGAQLNVAVSAAQIMTWSATQVTSTVPIRLPAGSGGTNSLDFGFAGTGFSSPNNTIIQFSTQGILRASVTSTSVTTTVPVVLPADPTTALQAATKQYVDARVGAIPPFPEAPIDANAYGRKGAAWVDVTEEAPSDANAYGRKAGNWVDVTEEAPADGLTYGRKNGAWAISIGGAYTDDAPPPGPLVDGQLWMRSTTGQMYCYYDDGNSSQWIQVSASPQVVDNNYRRKTANRYNMVVNGALNVSQENGNTEGATDNYWPADQFVGQLIATSAAYGVGRVSATNLSGSQFRLRYRVTTAKASLAAGDVAGIYTKLEGLNVQDLGWSSVASQKDAVLSFGFNGPAGTYTASVGGGSSYSFVAPFTITAGQANTDTVQTVKVPAPGASMLAWPTDNSAGIILRINFAAGSTYTAATAGWNSSNQFGVTGMSNGLAAVQSFQVWDIGLYADPDKTGLAPPFEIEDYATTLAKCKRYYVRGQFPLKGSLLSVTQIGRASCVLQTAMRAVPTVSSYGPSFNFFTIGSSNNTPAFSSIQTSYATVDLLEMDLIVANMPTPTLGTVASLYQQPGLGGFAVNARM